MAFRSHGTLAKIMVNLAKSWLTMLPLSRLWQIMIHGTLVKIMTRSWQDLDKITMVCHGPYQGYHVRKSIEPFSVIDRVPSWKAFLGVRGDGGELLKS